MGSCRICTGCRACETGGRIIGTCRCCGEDILDTDERYEFGNELIHRDCLTDWADEFLVRP